MDYYKLLEMDTENADIQLKLYKVCMAGAGDGETEAMEWLKQSAENGNEEAKGILASFDNYTIIADENKYSQTPSLELIEIAQYDYHAAKELYVNRNLETDIDKKIEIYTKLCRFDESKAEDFERLAELYYKKIYNSIYVGVSSNLFEKAREAFHNAIELGSENAKFYLANTMILNNNSSDVFELCNQAVINRSIYDKFLHYIAIKRNIVKASNSMYINAWEEEIEKDSDFMQSRFGYLFYLVRTDNIEEIKNLEVIIDFGEFSQEEAVVFAIAFTMCNPNCSIINEYYGDMESLNYMYFLYLYGEKIREDEMIRKRKILEEARQREEIRRKEEAKTYREQEVRREQERMKQQETYREQEFRRNQERMKQQEAYREQEVRRNQERMKQQEALRQEKEKKKNEELIINLCAIGSVVLGTISFISVFGGNKNLFMFSIIGLISGVFSWFKIKYNGNNTMFNFNISKYGIIISFVGFVLRVLFSLY